MEEFFGQSQNGKSEFNFVFKKIRRRIHDLTLQI